MERTEEMGPTLTPLTPVEGHYVDWAAILGGTVVAVAVASVFAGFGAALGFSTISANPGEGSFNFMAIVTAVWIVVTLVGSYMTGGYIAGRMRRRIETASADETTARDGINGLVVWGLGMIVSIFVLGSVVSATLSAAGSIASTAGSVAGGLATAAGSALGGVAQGALSASEALVPAAAKEDPMSYVASTLMRPAQVAPGTGTPAEMNSQAAAILGSVMATGEISAADRRYLESAVVANAGMTQPEAAAKVDAAVTAAQTAGAEVAKTADDAKAAAKQLEEDAKDLAVKAAELARVSAILTAFLLAASALVAGAAAYIGAVHGGRHRDESRIFGGFAYRR